MENSIRNACVDISAERRKTFLINNKVQQTMALEVLLAVFIVVNIMVTAAYFTLESATTFNAARDKLAFGIALVEIIGFGFLYYLTIRSSHKAVGPIFNLQRCMNAARQGGLRNRMEVRSTDYFQEIGTEYNTLISEYDSRIYAIQQLALRMESGDKTTEHADISELVAKLSWFKTTQPGTSK